MEEEIDETVSSLDEKDDEDSEEQKEEERISFPCPPSNESNSSTLMRVNIQGDSSVYAWGCWGGIPSFFNKYRYCFRIRFVHVICASLGASFAFSFHFSFMHHAGMR